MAETLRIVDGGTVTALRSQSLWHGIASAMQPGDPATLSFCRTAEPYVCLGFHRRLAEIDRPACRRLGLPIVRRQIGGGAVLVDGDQLLFQLTMPAERAPGRVDRLYQRLLAPAVEAFRGLGVDARLRGVNEIATGDRRLSGTGAGRIGAAVTVVGNVIFRFDHARMCEVLALPSESLRREYAGLLRLHLATLDGDRLTTASPAAARSAWIEAYGAAFGGAVPGALCAEEERQIATWERRFRQPDWLAGPASAVPPGRQVKVWAGAWVFENRGEGVTVRASIVDGVMRRPAVSGRRLNGFGRAMSEALSGLPADRRAVEDSLAPFGADGRRVAELLAPGLELR